MDRVLLACVLAFAAGIGLERAPGPVPVVAAAAAAAWMLRGSAPACARGRRVGLVLLLATAGILRSAADRVEADPLSRLLPRSSFPVRLEGEVRSVALRRDSMLLDLLTDRVHGSTREFETTAPVLVICPVAGVHPGDRVAVTGVVLSSGTGANPGSEAPSTRLRDRGYARFIDAKQRGGVRVLRAGSRWKPGRWLSTARQAVHAHLHERLRPPGGPVAAALLLGDASGLEPGFVRDLRRIGVWHLLVVSGLHVGLAAAGAAWMARKRGLGAGTAAALALVTATLYAGAAGFRPPALRALAALALAMLAPLLRRRLRPGHALATAALALLVLDPALVMSPGFHLTVGALAGLLRL
ncbi:MAG: ComEC/Rec2 family competence protein, partial [Planctomycetota bacterium]